MEEGGDVQMRRGTWLLAVRVLSDELWTKVTEGELTGFSIGGSARRVPEAVQAPEQSEPPAPAEPAPDEEAA